MSASTAGSWSAPGQLFDLGLLLWGCWFPSTRPTPDVAEGPVWFLGLLVQWLELPLLCGCQSGHRTGSGHQEQHCLLLAAVPVVCQHLHNLTGAAGVVMSGLVFYLPFCNCSMLPWCLSGVFLSGLVCPLTWGSCSLSWGLTLLLNYGFWLENSLISLFSFSRQINTSQNRGSIFLQISLTCTKFSVLQHWGLFWLQVFHDWSVVCTSGPKWWKCDLIVRDAQLDLCYKH